MTGETSFGDDLSAVRWSQLVEDLIADDFHNHRTPDELRRSFESSYACALAWRDGRVIGTARLLSDGVCNAYLVDVWTETPFRRQGIGSRMVRSLLERVPGQHVGLYTDEHPSFYAALGFVPAVGGMKTIVGTWLNRT